MFMSLDKAIKYGKEKRKPYVGSKVYFASCRNHGSCPYCETNRTHKFRDKHPRDEIEAYETIESINSGTFDMKTLVDSNNLINNQFN